MLFLGTEIYLCDGLTAGMVPAVSPTDQNVISTRHSEVVAMVCVPLYNISLPLVWNGYTYDKGRDLSDLHGTYNWPPIHVSYTLNRNCNFSVIRKPV